MSAVGEGPGVAFLHAGICDSRMWEGLPAAVGRGRRVVVYDQRGAGLSPWGEGGPFSHVDDLFAVLDAAAVERSALVGASHGGKVALDAALARPERVRALVLVAPAVGGWEWSPAVREYGRQEDELFEAGDLDACVELNLRMWVDGPRREPTEVERRLRAHVGRMQRRILEHYAAVLAAGNEPGPEHALEPPAVARLDEIGVPTLIVLGRIDQPDMLEIGATLAREIDGVSLHVVDGAAHLPSMERPGELHAPVGRFLDEVDAS